jgi:hypothetical protein
MFLAELIEAVEDVDLRLVIAREIAGDLTS